MLPSLSAVILMQAITTESRPEPALDSTLLFMQLAEQATPLLDHRGTKPRPPFSFSLEGHAEE